MSLSNFLLALKGGPKSGNYGHSGRPGKVGGSGGFSSYISLPVPIEGGKGFEVFRVDAGEDISELFPKLPKGGKIPVIYNPQTKTWNIATVNMSWAHQLMIDGATKGTKFEGMDEERLPRGYLSTESKKITLYDTPKGFDAIDANLSHSERKFLEKGLTSALNNPPMLNGKDIDIWTG